MSLLSPRALGWFGVSAVAGAAYVLLSRRVHDGATRKPDGKARREVLDHTPPRARRLAEATGHIGKWYVHVPAVLAAAPLLVRGRRLAAAAATSGPRSALLR